MTTLWLQLPPVPNELRRQLVIDAYLEGDRVRLRFRVAAQLPSYIERTLHDVSHTLVDILELPARVRRLLELLEAGRLELREPEPANRNRPPASQAGHAD